MKLRAILVLIVLGVGLKADKCNKPLKEAREAIGTRKQNAKLGLYRLCVTNYEIYVTYSKTLKQIEEKKYEK